MTFCNAFADGFTVSNAKTFQSSLPQPYQAISPVFVKILNPFHLKYLSPRLIFNFRFAEALIPTPDMCLYIFCYLETGDIRQDEITMTMAFLTALRLILKY